MTIRRLPAALAPLVLLAHAVLPGTRMRFWGIGDGQQIADLLAYLRTQR